MFWICSKQYADIIYKDENERDYVVIEGVYKYCDELMKLNTTRIYPGVYDKDDEGGIDYVEEEEDENEEEEDIKDYSHFTDEHIMKYWYKDAKYQFYYLSTKKLYDVIIDQIKRTLTIKLNDNEIVSPINIMLEEIKDKEYNQYSHYSDDGKSFYWRETKKYYEVTDLTGDNYIYADDIWSQAHPNDKIPSDVNKPQFFEENNVQTSWKKDTEFNPPWFWYKNQWSKVMMDEVYLHMKITIENEEHNCISILRDYEYEQALKHNPNEWSHYDYNHNAFYYIKDKQWYVVNVNDLNKDYIVIDNEMIYIDSIINDEKRIIEKEVYINNDLNKWSHYNIHADEFYFRETKQWHEVIREGTDDCFNANKGNVSIKYKIEEVLNNEEMLKIKYYDKYKQIEPILKEEAWEIEQQYYHDNDLNKWSHYDISGERFWWKAREYWFDITLTPDTDPGFEDFVEEQPPHHTAWIFDNEDKEKNSNENDDILNCDEEEEEQEEEDNDEIFTVSSVGEFLINPLSQYNSLKNRLEISFEVNMDIIETDDNNNITGRFYSRGYVHKIEILDISDKLSEITGFVKGEVRERTLSEAKHEVDRNGTKASYLIIRASNLFKPYGFDYLTLWCDKVYNTGYMVNLPKAISDPNEATKYYHNQIVGYLMNTVCSNQYMTTCF